METRDFRDCDAFAAAIRDPEVSVLIPRIDEPRWSVAYRQAGRVSLHHMVEGTGLIHTGRSRSGGNNVLIVLKSQGGARINGHPVEQQSVAVLGPRTDVCISLRGRSEWASISLPAEVATECVPRSCHGALQSAGCRIVPVPRPWWEALTAAMDHADGRRRRADAPATEDALLRALAPVLVGACQPEDRPAGRRPLSRDRLVRLAVMCIERQAGFRTSIDTLAAAVAVSRRTLLSLFQEYFGIGPLRYMRLRQLHGIRDLLLRSTSSTATVTSVAAQFNVWELGRLASDYLEVFGEYPSDTLARRTPPREQSQMEIKLRPLPAKDSALKQA